MKASIIIPAYNAAPYYRECLDSIAQQTVKDFEVIWVDSASTDLSLSGVREEYPWVRILPLNENAGYRGGANAGARLATGEYVVVCNQDIRVEPNWLENMIGAAATDSSIGIVAPKILLYDQPDVINEAGNVLHFSGLYGSRGLGQPATTFSKRESLATMSGCCFLTRRSVWEQLGGFSTDFDCFETGWHASYEDVDLAWRAQLIGFQVIFEPESVLYHRFERKGMFPARFCSYEWGRTITVLRNYAGFTLLLLLPMFALLEAGMTFYAAIHGAAWLREKRRIWSWCLTHRSELREMRRRIQATRRVSDCRILQRMSVVIDVAHQFGGVSGRIIQYAFDLFARTLHVFVRYALCAGRATG